MSRSFLPAPGLAPRCRDMNGNANDSQGGTERARELRHAAGISQERLAQLAGCSTSTVRLVERGWQPSPGMRERIAGALKHAASSPSKRTTRQRGATPGPGEV